MLTFQLKIQKDSEVLLRVVGTRVDATEIVRLRTNPTKSSPKSGNIFVMAVHRLDTNNVPLPMT